MKEDISCRIRRWFAPAHPCWQSSESRNRALRFLKSEEARVSGGLCLNVGSGTSRFSVPMINLDIFEGDRVDVSDDAQKLPFIQESFDTLVCTGVLEHLPDPLSAIFEIFRVLKPGGRVFIEAPFMQTYHTSPGDYNRWTTQGLLHLMKDFEVLELHIVAGPASALAWQIQETAALFFSFRSELLYKIGLRIFGWMAIPISWLDIFLEQHPHAGHAASGFALIAMKPMEDIA
ncbi:MAG: class I SAM-dependent methyltransferase [Pseudomonadota bacterium]